MRALGRSPRAAACPREHELGELLRPDLTTWERDVDGHDLLNRRRRMREHYDAIRQVDGLVDVVRHEEDRDAVLLLGRGCGARPRALNGNVSG